MDLPPKIENLVDQPENGTDSALDWPEKYDSRGSQEAKDRKKTVKTDKPYITTTETGRIKFNGAIMARAVENFFSPIVHEGSDYGNQFYNWDPENGVWKFLPESEIANRICMDLKDEAKKNRVVETMFLLERNTYHKPRQLECDPMWLNLKNGMIHLPDMRRAEHGPHFNSRVQLPLEYDPEAKCPLWIETLAGIFEDDLSKADVLQEFFGYCLYPKIIFPCAVFQIGAGSNGKGTVEKVLTAMLGRENVSHISLKRMEDRFGPVELKDKLLNACGETSSQALDVTNFKAIAAADAIQAEQKYKKDSVFVPIAKHMISMNAFPGIKDKTDAFFRRVIVVEYKQKFEGDNDDKSLDEKLLKELPGVFVWALEGLKRVLENERISVPDSVIDAKKRFRARTNPVLLFVDEVCYLGPDKSVLPPELYKSYKRWCDDGKVRPLAKHSLYERILTDFKVIRTRKKGESKEKFEGICVSPNSEF